LRVEESQLTIDQTLAELSEHQPSFTWGIPPGILPKIGRIPGRMNADTGWEWQDLASTVYLGGISQFISKLCVRNIQGLNLSIF